MFWDFVQLLHNVINRQLSLFSCQNKNDSFSYMYICTSAFVASFDQEFFVPCKMGTKCLNSCKISNFLKEWKAVNLSMNFLYTIDQFALIPLPMSETDKIIRTNIRFGHKS